LLVCASLGLVLTVKFVHGAILQPLFSASWHPKPGLAHWKDLLFNQWWSNEVATTNDSGIASFNVFKGDHRITVSHSGASKVVDVVVEGGKSGQHITVHL